MEMQIMENGKHKTEGEIREWRVMRGKDKVMKRGIHDGRVS